MSWEEARDRELAHWSAVRDAIGTAAPVDLLTEINAADAFCEKAREGAKGPIDHCARASSTSSSAAAARWAAA